MTKISNQYSLTNILTADLANSRLGINNVSPTVALDVTGAGKFSGALTGTTATFRVSDNRNLAIKYDTNITLSGQADSGAPENLRIYADTFKIFTSTTTVGLTERLTISNTGNVGIGTTSPSGQLHLKGASAVTSFGDQILQVESSTSNYSGIVFSGTSGANAAIRSEGASTMTFWTASGGSYTERMRITAAGNVGIGTSSPSQKLSLGSPLGIASSATTYSSNDQGSIMWSYEYAGIFPRHLDIIAAGSPDGTNGGSNIRFFTNPVTNAANSVERMRITNGGNVGIGTTNPAEKLSVLGTISVMTTSNAPTNSFVRLGTFSNGSWGSYVSAGTNYNAELATTLKLGTTDSGGNGTDRMTISTNGSIGAPSGTNIYNASDVRLKKNISTTTYGLDTISALNPVKFNWIDGFEPTENGKDMLGFIAQEVNEVIPEAIESFGGDINLNGELIDNPLRVNEKFIIPVLVKAIQELSAKVSLLENK